MLVAFKFHTRELCYVSVFTSGVAWCSLPRSFTRCPLVVTGFVSPTLLPLYVALRWARGMVSRARWPRVQVSNVVHGFTSGVGVSADWVCAAC